MTLHLPELAGQAAASADRAGDPLAMRFEALAVAAGVVAGLAGEASSELDANHARIGAALAGASSWQRSLAEDAIADMSAVMEPGIATLLSLSPRGADPRPAAQALWQEHVAACNALERTLGTR